MPSDEKNLDECKTESANFILRLEQDLNLMPQLNTLEQYFTSLQIQNNMK